MAAILSGGGGGGVVEDFHPQCLMCHILSDSEQLQPLVEFSTCPD